MLRAWRNELLGVTVVGLVLLLLGLLVGNTKALLGAGLMAYLGWHIFNLILLQRWVGYGRSFRLPVSLGVWEAVFDGLQHRQLRDRRRRASLAQTISEYRDAGGQLPDGLVVLDEDRRVLGFNAAAERLLGLRQPRDRGKDITRLIHHPALADRLGEARQGRPLEIASPVNGAWMLSLQTTASFGRSGRRLLIARDITPTYRIEQVRRDFVADVSHELRTPITVFRGYLDALREAVEASDWARPVAQLDKQATRMQELVEDLLLLSRLEMTRHAQSTEAVPVPEMLATIVEEARALSGDKRHQLSLETDTGICMLGDEADLRSAFSNLIFNAVRHTPPGTRVEITWDGGPDGAVLMVRDHGEGLAAHHLPRLTERFYRVDSSRSRHGGGTGLGLAIVKHALEHYDAELRITSEPGEGSTFSCHFPGSAVDIRSAEPAPGSHAHQA